ncbi:hypothetical protein CXG81DRAFT_30243 [Caulochytrium protostelioides]|uniref:AhpC/TSA family n=1 Tax=Caulochytrium protostelioides TaxID=1555241 RepID=A0A4P9X2X1_9FUNG|nr:AhpC/TSA family [Caulochytrium protostelioides]RKO99266.1 hypothetical protein CXG81DRAFT_30243 [Caulochytrium protostelioides]|eukprot:RKO99266.1 hypothetical protein CXG81DRAFT_30243 [Caulochytrium protostelioides]
MHPVYPAPAFKGQAVDSKREFVDLSLSQYKGKWVVLFTFPAAFTFVCPSEIVAFSDRVADFESINTQVIGCSTDTVHALRAWTLQPRKEGGLGDMAIPLYGDVTKELCAAYGILANPESGDAGLALRATFIIDPKGVLRHMSVNDTSVGRSVDETLRLVQAFQFTDENGVVCPVNWKKGGRTMHADPVKSKEYFAATN